MNLNLIFLDRQRALPAGTDIPSSPPRLNDSRSEASLVRITRLGQNGFILRPYKSLYGGHRRDLGCPEGDGIEMHAQNIDRRLRSTVTNFAHLTTKIHASARNVCLLHGFAMPLACRAVDFITGKSS